MLNFFSRNINLYLQFLPILHTDMKEVVEILSLEWKTKTYLSYIVNTMGADDLATQGARVSATMIWTWLNWDSSISYVSLRTGGAYIDHHWCRWWCRPRWAPCWPHEPCYQGTCTAHNIQALTELSFFKDNLTCARRPSIPLSYRPLCEEMALVPKMSYQLISQFVVRSRPAGEAVRCHRAVSSFRPSCGWLPCTCGRNHFDK